MIRQRILNYLEIKNISKYRFYQLTGLSNGFLDKEGAIGSDKCEHIISCFPDINIEWLLLGKGEMLVENSNNVVSEPTLTYGEQEKIKELEYLISVQKRLISSLEKEVDELSTKSRRSKVTYGEKQQ